MGSQRVHLHTGAGARKPEIADAGYYGCRAMTMTAVPELTHPHSLHSTVVRFFERVRVREQMYCEGETWWKTRVVPSRMHLIWALLRTKHVAPAAGPSAAAPLPLPQTTTTFNPLPPSILSTPPNVRSTPREMRLQSLTVGQIMRLIPYIAVGASLGTPLTKIFCEALN